MPASFRTNREDAIKARQAVRNDVQRIADNLAADVAARTPTETGTLRLGWRVVPGNDPATFFVTNDVPYARFVEYGTRYVNAVAMLGQALAAAKGGRLR